MPHATLKLTISKPEVSATVRFLEAIRVFKNLLVSLNNHTYMEHINLLDFDDKSHRNWCFLLQIWGLHSTALIHIILRPWKMGNSAGSEVTNRLTATEINRSSVKLVIRVPTDKISMIFQWYFKTKIPNFHDNSERSNMEKQGTTCYTWSLHTSYDHYWVFLRKSVKSYYFIWWIIYQ